jgi:autotransporter-associated beta strand protein
MNKGRDWRAVIVGVMSVVSGPSAWGQSSGNRLLGLDVSAWQGNISQTTWNNLRTVENRQFVFLRATRGGTTGVDHRAGGYPAGDTTNFSLSQRYDDPYFVQNINRATTAGMFAGSYHFARPDIIATTTNANGIANTAIDEANHYMQMAGAFMRPGYLAPTFDLEAGDGIRTDNELAQYAIDFSNRIFETMRIRPMIYLNGNYAQNVLGGATAALRDQLAQPAANPPSLASPAYSQLWIARYPNPANPNGINVQTGNPSDSLSTVYGIFDDYGNSQPWVFWQYASTGRLASFNGGNSDLDFNVVNGGMDYLKDQLIPAVWWNDASGDWSTLSNWNSGQTPTAPISSPGQLTPIGTQTMPTPRLPGAAGSGPASGANDTVILDRPNADITITLGTGTHNIRKLYVRETLNITGGSLTVNYVPVAESTPLSMQVSAAVSVSGGASLSAHTILVDATRTLSAANASLTFDTITLNRGTTPATLTFSGDVTVQGTAGGTAKIGTNAGTLASGRVDLAGGQRTVTVVNSAAATDLQIAVPIINGGLTKSGTGTLRLTAANTFTGPTTVAQGRLVVDGSLGAGDVAVNAGASLGGTGTMAGRLTVAGGSTPSTRGSLDLTDGQAATLRLTNPGSAETVLTLGGVAGSPSAMTFEIGLTADRIQIDTGKILVNPGGASITITGLPGLTNGTYDLIAFPSGQATGLSFLSLTSASVSGYSISLQTTPTSLQVVVVPEPMTMGGIALVAMAWLAKRRRHRLR